MRLLETLADRIADRLSLRLEGALERFEARIEEHYSRMDKRAAAKLLAGKRWRDAHQETAVFEDPPSLNGSVLDARRRLRGY